MSQETITTVLTVLANVIGGTILVRLERLARLEVRVAALERTVFKSPQPIEEN
jgi:hypothetical protein